MFVLIWRLNILMLVQNLLITSELRGLCRKNLA
ncbi:unnamed protein product [Brugia timori]|uniref:Uncharacterized protein n=1 Tax=Brugia timori TaxID=42155 RepID=A0A0R3R3P9_9BILA|nr:unnamed protein product [Brugia timori]